MPSLASFVAATGQTESVNVTLLHAINGLAGSHPALDAIGRFAAEDLLYLLGIAVFAVGMSVFRSGPRVGVQIAMAGLLAVGASLAIAVLLSHLWYEARPFVSDPTVRLLIAHPDDSGFPSDHVAVAAAAVTVATVYRRWVGLPLGIGVLGLALGRVFVGVHYPGDVLAACILGLTMGLAGTAAAHAIIGGGGPPRQQAA